MKIIAKYNDGTTPGATQRHDFTCVRFNTASFESALEQALLPQSKNGKRPAGCLLVWLFVDDELVWTKDGEWVRSPATVE